MSKLFSKYGVIGLAAGLLFSAPVSAPARDERSTNELRVALIALNPQTVDPAEADLVATTAHQMARQLAKDYRLVLNPPFQNFLVNIGLREKGYCAHYTRDIGRKMKEFHLKTLVLHWGAAYAREPDESNCLVVTARSQPFQDGIILDAWRKGGRLYWSPLMKDTEYQVDRGLRLNQLGANHYSGITAWKEDMKESAWLQDSKPEKPAKKAN